MQEVGKKKKTSPRLIHKYVLHSYYIPQIMHYEHNCFPNSLFVD